MESETTVEICFSMTQYCINSWCMYCLNDTILSYSYQLLAFCRERYDFWICWPNAGNHFGKCTKAFIFKINFVVMLL